MNVKQENLLHQKFLSGKKKKRICNIGFEELDYLHISGLPIEIASARHRQSFINPKLMSP